MLVVNTYQSKSYSCVVLCVACVCIVWERARKYVAKLKIENSGLSEFLANVNHVGYDSHFDELLVVKT